jgi:hypothetical protein
MFECEIGRLLWRFSSAAIGRGHLRIASPAEPLHQRFKAHPKSRCRPSRYRSAPGGDYINWLTFSDNAKGVVEDVSRIRNHPLVPNDIPIYGYIDNVKSGKTRRVPEANTAGKAS